SFLGIASILNIFALRCVTGRLSCFYGRKPSDNGNQNPGNKYHNRVETGITSAWNELIGRSRGWPYDEGSGNYLPGGSNIKEKARIGPRKRTRERERLI